MLSILKECHIIDLSHDLEEENPTWTAECGFSSQIDLDYEEVGYRGMSCNLILGTGTHMDAPSHFVRGAKDIASLNVKNFVAPLVVIRVSTENHPDYLLAKEDVLAFESKHGEIQEGSFVVADTNWAQYWGDTEAYRNPDEENQMHFPGFSVDAVNFLLKRKIVGIGIDTLSPDGGSTEFPVHHLLLPQEKFIIENLTNLDKVPEKGAWVINLPTKIKRAAEAPCHCIALIPPF